MRRSPVSYWAHRSARPEEEVGEAAVAVGEMVAVAVGEVAEPGEVVVRQGRSRNAVAGGLGVGATALVVLLLTVGDLADAILASLLLPTSPSKSSNVARFELIPALELREEPLLLRRWPGSLILSLL